MSSSLHPISLRVSVSHVCFPSRLKPYLLKTAVPFDASISTLHSSGFEGQENFLVLSRLVAYQK